MKPSIGRIVIFCHAGNEAPAIVTAVPNEEIGAVSLTVFPAPFAQTPTFAAMEPVVREPWVLPKGTHASEKYWKWPERV